LNEERDVEVLTLSGSKFHSLEDAQIDCPCDMRYYNRSGAASKREEFSTQIVNPNGCTSVESWSDRFFTNSAVTIGM